MLRQHVGGVPQRSALKRRHQVGMCRSGLEPRRLPLWPWHLCISRQKRVRARKPDENFIRFYATQQSQPNDRALLSCYMWRFAHHVYHVHSHDAEVVASPMPKRGSDHTISVSR